VAGSAHLPVAGHEPVVDGDVEVGVVQLLKDGAGEVGRCVITVPGRHGLVGQAG